MIAMWERTQKKYCGRPMPHRWTLHKRLLIVVLTWLCMSAVPVVLPAATIVTIIDDDTRSVNAVESVKTVADRHGVKMTFAAIAAHLERNPDVAAKLREYVEEGHEIASHSLTHRPGIWKAGDSTDVEAIRHEVVESEEVFKRLGLYPKTFVYPYGNFSRKTRREIFDVVSQYYPVAFNARGDINLPGKTYPLYVSRHPLRKHNSFFMMKRLVDEAVAADNAWLVVLTHSANSDFSADMLDDLISYAQKNGAVFLPASVAWEQIKDWPMMNEDELPDYSKLGDYANAAHFHLPLLLECGIVFLIICAGLVWLYLRYRPFRKKSRA